ncbi:MAG: type II secretion system F family protein [Armatimonadota bacterium]
MPSVKNTYNLKTGSLKEVLEYIEKETRRQKNKLRRKNSSSELVKSLAARGREDALYYDRSARSILTGRKFLQIYPFKLNLRYDLNYIKDNINDRVRDYLDKADRDNVFKSFFREMAVMLKSGISIIPALDTAKKHTKSKRFGEVLERMMYDLKANGASVTEVFARFPNYFSNMHISVIKAGEKSSNMPLVFEELAQLEEKKRYLMGKLKGALIYPVTVGIFSFVILFIIAKMLVPAILALSSTVDIMKIKGLAKAVIFTAKVFSYPLTGYMLTFMGLAVIYMIYSYIKTPVGRYKWDKFKISIPFIGDALLKMYVINFCMTLHMLHKAGINIIPAVKILSGIFENTYVKRKLDDFVFSKIPSGENLSTGLKMVGFFPPVALQLIRTGEESGRLVELLQKVIDIYKMEVEDVFIRLSNILEPVIIIIFGIVICFIALVAMLPIYQIISVF